ncbi:hypothetical protein [Halodesulfovibrio marinisediminis]|uniref:Phosphatidate cytidylyltransferase n=1 Tax=Halodesulfovibrio marinisediminis DSM 17456 TaxID=1121457 RepID=A0A1N6ISL2_9BACT|nr:hypothetical protein [Halodesulfovibrio marinisediminis]SIO34973.1 hypothetical protein SAMN02745161_2884 [Halodesulfovibrio marinisediminis DSM 17456]
MFAERWRTICALVFALLCIIFNWQWGVGVMFLIWVIRDIASGESHFVEVIKRSEELPLYVLVIFTQLFFALFFLVTDFPQDVFLLWFL